MAYADISEKAFTAQVIKLARWYGWRVAHFRPGLTQRGRWITAVQGDGAGFPDLFMLRHNRAICAELKAAKGKASPEQLLWLAAAKNASIEVYLWKPEDIDQIEAILQ